MRRMLTVAIVIGDHRPAGSPSSLLAMMITVKMSGGSGWAIVEEEDLGRKRNGCLSLSLAVKA